MALPGGCISYPLDLLPAAGPLPAPPAPDQRVSVDLMVRMLPGTDLQSASGDFPELLPVDPDAELSGVLTRTGWFREVRLREDPPRTKGGDKEQDGDDDTAKPAPADLELDVVLTTRANGVVMLASACLLFVIPTWRTVEFELVAEVRARDGRWQRYSYADSARDVHWIPLLLVMSWWPWGESYRDLRVNLYDHLLLDLQRDGFLARPAG
ncbi:MAG: hypothetical protein FJ296_03500 [Planctomycetes bacterium]|nr:hypothetical protein [Planctomycetota bacterium]